MAYKTPMAIFMSLLKSPPGTMKTSRHQPTAQRPKHPPHPIMLKFTERAAAWLYLKKVYKIDIKLLFSDSTPCYHPQSP